MVKTLSNGNFCMHFHMTCKLSHTQNSYHREIFYPTWQGVNGSAKLNQINSIFEKRVPTNIEKLIDIAPIDKLYLRLFYQHNCIAT